MYRMINPMQTHTIPETFPNRIPVHDSFELEEHLKERVRSVAGQSSALALSGGIDSAILARFMPKGSIAYTFKCIVPGVQVTDESSAAARYAEECGLQHKIVEIYWEDFEQYSNELMLQKGAPIHSIEVQIYKAALQAKKDGIDTLVFGEAADAVYGGLSGLLSKDWRVGEFIQRYSFLLPYLVLKNPELPIEPYKQWENDGVIDPHKFISNVFIQESVASYLNAAKLAGVKMVLPYPETYLDGEIDYSRIRAGENKYLVREVFQRLYPDFDVPPKTPMPRPMNEWFKNWSGPKRDEFYPHCSEGLTGDQKWLLWILERYLNM
jgi:hypothetical protein